MIRPSVARKYARALVAVASRRGVLERVVAESSAIAGIASEDVALRHFLESPAYPEAAKKSLMLTVLGKLYPDGLDLASKNFLEALALHHRLGDYLAIVQVLQDAVDDRQGIVRAELTTAGPLTADQQRTVESALAKATARQVRLEHSVDRGLLGGVVTRIGSTIYDGSVRTRLQKMKERIAREGVA